MVSRFNQELVLRPVYADECQGSFFFNFKGVRRATWGIRIPKTKNLLFFFFFSAINLVTPGRGRILLQGKDLIKKRGENSFPLSMVSRANDSDPTGWTVNSRYNKDVDVEKEKHGAPCNGRELRDRLTWSRHIVHDTQIATSHTIHVRN